MRVITVSGHARHGKDATAEILEDLFKRRGKKVLVCHYADLLKYICKTFFDWNGEKDEYGRTLLQRVGTDRIRNECNRPTYWVDFICDILMFFKDEWDYVIIPDTRFPNEIDRLNERAFCVTSINVVRPNFDSGLTDEQKNHPSETALDGYKYFDYVVVNDRTLNELREKLYTISKEI